MTCQLLEVHPLTLLNTKSNEPYLRLPAPHSNIILTPPRLTEADEKAIVEYLNNIEVGKWLSGTPFPYLPSHARQWMEKTYESSQKVLEEINEKPIGSPINGCPFRILREVKEDGQDTLIGDCGIGTWLFDDIEDPGEKAKATEQNEARRAGDPLKEWGFGGEVIPVIPHSLSGHCRLHRSFAPR